MCAAGSELAAVLTAAAEPPAEPALVAAWIALATVVALLSLTYVPGAIHRVWNARRLRRLSKGRLVVTFDDGPSPGTTPRILDLLDEFGVRATFFVIGRRADERPDLCDALRQRGHEIGSHSQRHVHAWTRPLAAVQDVRAGCRSVARWAGPTPVFRPPCGKVSLWTWLAARLAGFRVAVWTIDTEDALDRAAEPASIIAKLRADGGGVVLMHDLDWAPGDPRDGATLAIARELLAAGRELGLETCTMSELIADGPSARGTRR